MKREAKRLASALLSLALVLGLMPGTAPTAFAEEPMEPPANDVQESPDARPLTNTTPQMRVAPESMEPQSQAVSYIERRWDDNTGAVIEEVKECTSYTLVTSNDTSWGSGWYVVQGDNTVINGRLSITGEANLILCDGAKLTVQQGITTTGAMLNIYAQSGGSGVLYAGTTDGTTSTCALGSAGIGGNPENSGGTVNIHGGSVTAIGGINAAGIGSGFELAVSYASRAIVVATADPGSLRDAQQTAALLTERGLSPVQMVVNRVTRRLLSTVRSTIDDMMDHVGLPLLGLIPEDQTVHAAAADNQALVLQSRKGAAMGCLRIARRLLGMEAPLMRIR